MISRVFSLGWVITAVQDEFYFHGRSRIKSGSDSDGCEFRHVTLGLSQKGFW